MNAPLPPPEKRFHAGRWLVRRQHADGRYYYVEVLPGGDEFVVDLPKDDLGTPRDAQGYVYGRSGFEVK